MRRLSWMSKYIQRSPHKKIVEGSFKVGYFSHYYIGVVCLESRCIFRGPHTKFLYECRLQGWQYRLHALDKIYNWTSMTPTITSTTYLRDVITIVQLRYSICFDTHNYSVKDERQNIRNVLFNYLLIIFVIKYLSSTI